MRWRIGFCIRHCCNDAQLAVGFECASYAVRYYQQRAEQNRVREVPLVAPRGRIYDREHRILADNRPSYNVILIRENSPHTIEQTAAMLSSGINMSKDEVLERINRRKRDPKFRPIVLKEDVAVGDIAFVKAHKYELPEISVEFQPRRRYLEGEMAAHALGYVGEVTENELVTPEFVDFRSGDQVGKAGLEREYNSVLIGKDGFKRVIVNTQGREMGQLDAKEYVSGNDLVTTLDLDLQRAAEETIGDRSGAVVALDPENWRNSCVRQQAGIRPQPFCDAHFGSGLEEPDGRPAQADAESRDSKPVLARIRIQGLHGCSGSGSWNP
jgi:penicillin-binding protein 2